MPNETVTSTIAIKLNAREINGLPAVLKKVFNAGPARELTAASRDVSKAFQDNLSTASRLVNEMAKVQKGTAEFRKLRDELKETNATGQILERTMQRITTATERAAKAADTYTGGKGTMAPGGGGGGGGGIGAGRGSGGGAGAGGGFGLGSALNGFMSQQAPMLGMGALTAGLAGIPLVGGAAAGSAMAAFQQYGSYLSERTGYMNASPFINRGAFAASRTLAGTGGGGGGRPGGKMSNTRTGNNAAAAALGLGAEMTPEQLADMSAQLGGANGITKAGAKAADAVGLVPGRNVSQAMEDKARDQAAAADSEAKRTGPRTVSALSDFYSNAVQMGYKPQEAIAMAGQLGQASGRRVNAEQSSFGLAASRAFGLDVGTTGSLMRGMRRTGGEDTPEAIAKLIGQQVALGLEGSELNEALQEQAAFLDQQQQQLRSLSMGGQGVANMAKGLAGAGIPAYAATGMVQQFTQGAAARGQQGANSATDIRMAKAMGIDISNREGYAEFQLALQDPDRVAMAMGKFGDQFRSQGFGKNFQALMMQRAFAQYGTNIGPVGARAMAAGGFGPGDASGGMTPEEIQKIAIANTPGVNRAEAGLELQRVGTGGEMAGSMIDLQKTLNNMAGSFSEFAPIVKLVTGDFVDLSDRIRQLSSVSAKYGVDLIGAR